jgi:TPR repeat protein
MAPTVSCSPRFPQLSVLLSERTQLLLPGVPRISAWKQGWRSRLLFESKFICRRRGRSGFDLRGLQEYMKLRPIYGLGSAIALVACLTAAACTPQTGLPKSAPQATAKSGFVIDSAANALISEGDKSREAKDYPMAFKLYREASEDRDVKVKACALNRIGELYAWGFGVPQDYAQAFEQYKKSALLGNAYGAANLANSLFFGQGTDRNLVDALEWAKKGADGNVPMALNQIGWQFLNGMGVPIDNDEARRRYNQSASLRDPVGESQLGWMYGHVDPVDYQLAMKWYRLAAEQHQEMAQNNIGFLYENGLGVKQDYVEAARWYQMAAVVGYARAQFHLGNLYDLGLGVPHDKGLAVEWIRKAADAGDPAAVQWLAAH